MHGTCDDHEQVDDFLVSCSMPLSSCILCCETFGIRSLIHISRCSRTDNLPCEEYSPTYMCACACIQTTHTYYRDIYALVSCMYIYERMRVCMCTCINTPVHAYILPYATRAVKLRWQHQSSQKFRGRSLGNQVHNFRAHCFLPVECASSMLSQISVHAERTYTYQNVVWLNVRLHGLEAYASYSP
jgi:hypothetical protein